MQEHVQCKVQSKLLNEYIETFFFFFFSFFSSTLGTTSSAWEVAGLVPAANSGEGVATTAVVWNKGGETVKVVLINQFLHTYILYHCTMWHTYSLIYSSHEHTQTSTHPCTNTLTVHTDSHILSHPQTCIYMYIHPTYLRILGDWPWFNCDKHRCLSLINSTRNVLLQDILLVSCTSTKVTRHCCYS